MSEIGKFTSETSNVYLLNPELLSLVLAAAGMARLSRSPKGFREIIDTEFSGINAGKENNLIRRVVTEFGDDSVAQLITTMSVVEGASNLLTKKLEWGRLGSYLEQSTRYIRYDRKDENGKYPYVTPTELQGDQAQDYNQTMDKIFDNYSVAVQTIIDHLHATLQKPVGTPTTAWNQTLRAQACDAARELLPVSSKSTVGMVMSAQALEALIIRLNASGLEEDRSTGHELLAHSRKIIEPFMERADKPGKGAATTEYMKNKTQVLSTAAYDLGLVTEQSQLGQAEADLIDFSPKNELDIVPWLLFDESTVSIRAIQARVEKMSTDEKVSVFNNYVGDRTNRRHKPGRAFERINYDWESVCDYGIFRDLQRHRMVDDMRWQVLSPDCGRTEHSSVVYDTGLAGLYERTYDLSEQLHAALAISRGTEFAQYATLLGHKMRWTMRLNARAAFHVHELRTAPQGHTGYRRLVQDMHKQVAEVHPLVASGMVHVDMNTGADLTRLASEERAAKKLAALDSTQQ